MKVLADREHMLRTLDQDAGVALEVVDGKSGVVWRTDDGYSHIMMPLSRE